MYNAISSLKLRNRLHKVNPDLEVILKNVRINGVLHGASGFVVHPETEKVVYVSTDVNHGINADKALYRNARDTKDYRGSRNRYSAYDADEIALDVVELLESDDQY